MTDKEAQVDWDDDGFLDTDECYKKVRQLRAKLGRLQMLLSQDGTAYLPCQRCHKNVAVPTLESVELCFDCWEQMNTKAEQLQREKDDITATLTAEYDQLEKAFDAGWEPERLRAQKAEAWTEQLQRLLHDERVRRDEWEKMYNRLIAGTEVEQLQERLGQVKIALNHEVDSRVRAGLEVERLRAQAANVREAVEWLWGFWDGDSLVAIRGFGDDIRDAWGKLWVALDSANDVTQPQEQAKRLATVEQQLARRDIEYSAASRAALALEERLVTAERRAEGLHRVMMDANRIVDVALDDCQVKSTYCDGCPASARDRILWLNERAGRAEVLATLVTPELAGLLESLARYWYQPEMYDEAIAFAACIRETLEETE